jgi:hypothetical protein
MSYTDHKTITPYTNKPLASATADGLQLSAWQNTGAKGAYTSYSFSKSYKDKEGKEQTQQITLFEEQLDAVEYIVKQVKQRLDKPRKSQL